MTFACWASKGGAGTTVLAAQLASQLASHHGNALLIDLAGDMPLTVGLPDLEGPGAAGWLRGESGALELFGVGNHVSLLPRGEGPLDPARAEKLAGQLAKQRWPVVIDCGTAPEGAAKTLAIHAEQSLLVTRPCSVALARAHRADMPRPTGVVLIQEPDRVLTAPEVAAAVGVPVVAEVPLDPKVARAVDSGLLMRDPIHTSAMRSLQGIAPDPARLEFDKQLQQAMRGHDFNRPTGHGGLSAW